ncbi:MAG: hypothetical protein IIC90_08870 [Chloroflexi bacterium]|nr:hypothetical protein [Chloroflexota bacterium]
MSCKIGEMLWKEGEGPNKKGTTPIGFNIILKTEKNKTSQPLLVCEIPFYFTGDTDSLFQLFQVGLTYGIVTQGGAYYKYKDKNILGRPKFLEYLEKNPDVQESLVSDIQEVIENDQ